MNSAQSKHTLPISGRPLPDVPAWLDQVHFLVEAGQRSLKTETTYRSGLRLFADWLQYYGKANYQIETPWPLSPQQLTTAVILNFRNWLLSNRSRSTATTYLSAIIGYLYFLDGQNKLPPQVQLGKLQRQLTRRQIERNQAESVIDMDVARQYVPDIVTYYNQLPLPATNDRYNRRLSLLRDRAIVNTLYSTAARISEVVSLNRNSMNNGRSAYVAIMGKGGKPRTIHIRPYAQQAIYNYLRERKDSNQALFVAHSHNVQHARLSITSVHNIVKKAVYALNLNRSLSAHDFRHYRATQLLRAGMPLEAVQEFLGHSDISTTRGIYAPVLGIKIVTQWLDSVDIAPNEATQKEEMEGK